MQQGVTSRISPQVWLVWLGLNLVVVRFSYNRNPSLNLILTKPNQIGGLTIDERCPWLWNCLKKNLIPPLLTYVFDYCYTFISILLSGFESWVA